VEIPQVGDPRHARLKDWVTVLGKLKRWLYGADRHRPGAFMRAFNRADAALFSRGLGPRSAVTLEVTGRRSGRTVEVPLAVAEVDGDRYLVSMLGEDVGWVRNVRAAGGRAVLRRRRREEVLLEEVPVAERAPIIKAYLKVAPGARPHIPVRPDAPLQEFEAVADRHPVFRVGGRR